VVQVVELLPSNPKALGSNLSTTRNNRGGGKKERRGKRKGRKKEEKANLNV
jgi:hypothetical protein